MCSLIDEKASFILSANGFPIRISLSIRQVEIRVFLECPARAFIESRHFLGCGLDLSWSNLRSRYDDFNFFLSLLAWLRKRLYKGLFPCGKHLSFDYGLFELFRYPWFVTNETFNCLTRHGQGHILMSYVRFRV